jgi:hypothetical protein
MTVNHIRKPTYFLLIAVLEQCCTKYLATAEFVEQVVTSLTVLMAEHMLTQGRHCIAQLLIRVLIQVTEPKQVWGK